MLDYIQTLLFLILAPVILLWPLVAIYIIWKVQGFIKRKKPQWREPINRAAVTAFGACAVYFLATIIPAHNSGSACGFVGTLLHEPVAFIQIWFIAFATVCSVFAISDNRFMGTMRQKVIVTAAALVLCASCAYVYKITGRKIIMYRAQTSQNSAALGLLCEKAITSRDLEVLERITHNKATTQTILEDIYTAVKSSKIASDTYEKYPINYGLAGNSHTPPYILQELAKEPDSSIRSTVATNKATPKDTLETLSADTDAMVRYWADFTLGKNPRWHDEGQTCGK